MLLLTFCSAILNRFKSCLRKIIGSTSGGKEKFVTRVRIRLEKVVLAEETELSQVFPIVVLLWR